MISTKYPTIPTFPSAPSFQLSPLHCAVLSAALERGPDGNHYNPALCARIKGRWWHVFEAEIKRGHEAARKRYLRLQLYRQGRIPLP